MGIEKIAESANERLIPILLRNAEYYLRKTFRA
jgi:hypothetical protein